jgi:gliding motility-associated-like protein
MNFTPASGNAQTYTWDFGDNNTSAASTPSNNYQYGGSYQVSLTTNKDYACEEKTIALVRAPDPVEEYLYIPNSFSPNGDGINDVFAIYGHSNCGEYQLTIFNRWGEVVYYTTDINKFWDGKQDGKAVQSGVYCYVITENGNKRTGMVYVYL